jgi:hypothetical protein
MNKFNGLIYKILGNIISALFRLLKYKVLFQLNGTHTKVFPIE